MQCFAKGKPGYWKTRRHAQQPKTRDGDAYCAQRSPEGFTAMKRFVNRMNVVLRADVTKDCAHEVASIAHRLNLRAHPPVWVADAGCVSELCAAAGASTS